MENSYSLISRLAIKLQAVNTAWCSAIRQTYWWNRLFPHLYGNWFLIKMPRKLKKDFNEWCWGNWLSIGQQFLIFQIRILYPGKIFLKSEKRVETFSLQQKLKKFITRKHELKQKQKNIHRHTQSGSLGRRKNNPIGKYGIQEEINNDNNKMHK